MTNTHQELADIARLVSGLVEWDLEEDALGYPASSAVLPEVALHSNVPHHEIEEGVQHGKTPSNQESDITFSGAGNPSAGLIFIGEAGKHQQGPPFDGDAGVLLDKMIQAMGLRKEDVYLCNLREYRALSHQAPGSNRERMSPAALRDKIRAMEPRIVVAMGQFASHTLLNISAPLDTIRGTWHPFYDAELIPTYHPAHLLRNPSDKRKAWKDLQSVMGRLGLTK